MTRTLFALAFLIWMVAALVALWQRRRRAATGLLLAVWVPLLWWWQGLAPSNDRRWAADVARPALARIDGDTLTVANVRDFTWRTDTDFDERWDTRRYDLRALRGADLFLSYWAGENVAHAIVSFDFADKLPLAFSIEIRREQGEAYSATAGFFKSYELALIAADERDIVKVRTTVRGEDVRLYRLDIRRATALGLLREYVALSQDLARRPRWYHTLTANCTTVIFGMARRLDPRVAFDWRIVLPGRLPSYLSEHAFVSRAVPLAELVTRASIAARAAGAPPDPGFSARIRRGVPRP